MIAAGLTLASASASDARLPTDEADRAATVALTAAAPAADGRGLAGLPEEAVMVLLGTMLIGIAAAVRRSA